MPTDTLPDADIDPELSTGIDLNDIQSSVQERFQPDRESTELSHREKNAFEGMTGSNYTNTTADVQDIEEAGNSGVKFRGSDRTWENRVTPHDVVDKNKLGQAMGFAKKHKGILGLISVFGVSGAMLTAFFGPASMIINLMENLSITNDTSSKSFERRFLKVFQNASTQDPVCVNATKKTIKCSMGTISNKALKDLEKKGVVGLADGKPVRTKSTGYPDKRPTHYEIDLKDGTAPKRISVNDLPGFLSQSSNRKLASKVLGTGGAINLRVKTWMGKHIYSKFYNKFGIRPTGGIATALDGLGKKATSKLGEYLKKLPGAQKISQVGDSIRTKLDRHMGKIKKAGAPYTLAVASCMTVKAPSMIAAGVAAVQLAQILPPIMDFVLSPGSVAKANGVTNTFTSEGMEAVGDSLTEQVPNKDDGKLASALDSPFLLAALGVDKGKPAPSTKFTPGFSALTNRLVLESRKASDAAAPACNKIMSPAAMYAAMAADITATLLLSASLIGGVLKIAASFAAQQIATELVLNIVSNNAKEFLTKLAQNEDIPKARGKEFGDILGIGASAFFAAGGMSRHLPVISKSKLAEVSQEQQLAEQMRQEMDIASLSPFDTSSRYTFLGSIVNNIKFAMLANNSYNDSLYSVVSNIVRMPQLATSIATPQASAADITRLCDYASYFGLETGDDATTPAINMAGLPCVGYDSTQVDMPVTEALDLMVEEKWINEDADISINDSIEDLITKGFIVKDTPLHEAIESCSDASTGDYLFSAASCIPPDAPGDENFKPYCPEITNEEGEKVEQCVSIDDGQGGTEEPSLTVAKNPRSMKAINVFLGDYQVLKSMNGEDEGYGGGIAPGSSGTISLVDPTQWAVPANHSGSIDKTSDQWKRWVTDIGGNGNSSTGVLKPIGLGPEICPSSNSLNQNGGGDMFNPNAAASAKAMIEAFNKDNPGRYLTPGACFRSYSAQRDAWIRNGGSCVGNECTGSTGGAAAQPGTSNHGWGLAIDMRVANRANTVGTGITSFTSADYLWLKTNGPQFGWINPLTMTPSGRCGSGQKCEPWHFQYVGPLYGS